MDVKCTCQTCNGHIQFDSEHAGTTIACPHCGIETRLFVPQAPQLRPTSRSNRKILLAMVSVLGIAGITGLLFIPSKQKATASPVITELPPAKPIPPPVDLKDKQPPQPTQIELVSSMNSRPMLITAAEKQARDDLLKAFLKISSATSVGVTYGRYGELVTETLTELRFQKTKLDSSRHQKFLASAVSALQYYKDAHDEWGDYFKYEFLQDREALMLSRETLLALKENGAEVDFSKYVPTDQKREFFYVPIKTALSLYWHAAGKYLEMLKQDVED